MSRKSGHTEEILRDYAAWTAERVLLECRRWGCLPDEGPVVLKIEIDDVFLEKVDPQVTVYVI